LQPSYIRRTEIQKKRNLQLINKIIYTFTFNYVLYIF